MADNEIKYLGQGAAEQLIQNAKSTATSKVADHNTSSEAHADIRDDLAEIKDYITNIDYDGQLAFDTTEIVFENNTFSMLDRTIYEQTP